jgi:hydrogenase-4 component H
MGIWNILSRNAVQGSRTRRPSDDVPFPEGFRGTLRHILEQCSGCGVCAYVCSPTAVSLVASGPGSTVWTYFAGKCTFCGRCVEYCPTEALDLDRSAPPITGDPSRHRVAHVVVFPPCQRCGRPVLPMPATLLVRLYGEPVPEAIQAGRRLCERCRGRASAETMKAQIGARRCE